MKNMVPDFDCRTIWHRTIGTGQFGTRQFGTGQFGTKIIKGTIWHQDNKSGQFGTKIIKVFFILEMYMYEIKNMVPDFDCRTIWHRTIWHQDNKSGQFGTRTILHQDNLAPDNLAPGQFGTKHLI